MKKITILSAIICCAILLPCFSANTSTEAVLDYLEGTLQQKVNNKWVDLMAGDKIPVSATIKAGDNTLAEIILNGAMFTIVKKGTYVLEKIVKQNKDSGITDVGSLITKKIASVVDEGKSEGEGNMGVRAKVPDILSKAEEINFYDPLAENFKTGYDALNEGDYEKAATYFQKCLDDALESEQAECLYYLAYTYYRYGKVGRALKFISKLTDDKDVYYFEEYAMMKGDLLVRIAEYTDALKILSLSVKEYPKGRFIQDIYFLTATCYAGLNKKADQKKFLEKVCAVDAATEIGKSAKKLLDELK